MSLPAIARCTSDGACASGRCACTQGGAEGRCAPMQPKLSPCSFDRDCGPGQMCYWATVTELFPQTNCSGVCVDRDDPRR